MKIVPQSATLLAMTPDPIFLIERCGRVCWKSEDRMECQAEEPDRFLCDKGFVNDGLNPRHACPSCLDRATKFDQGILKRKHDSVLEHASATFLFVTDRGISHEICRHRIASYSQESTRFCNYGNKGGDITVIKPELSGQDLFEWEGAMIKAEQAYLSMIANKVEPQWARSVLPTCLKTELVMTANFRQWRHVLRLRLNNEAGVAHPQVRSLMAMVLKVFLESEAALFFEDIRK